MTFLLEFIELRHNNYMGAVWVSNKHQITPVYGKGEPEIHSVSGCSIGGYRFDRFLGNCYSYLGELAKLEGMQQLVHSYYLHNGTVTARDAASRIKNFIG